jgi:hypothetical protein
MIERPRKLVRSDTAAILAFKFDAADGLVVPDVDKAR